MTTLMPTIALVHGAFAESSSWDGVVDHLRRGSAGTDAQPRHAFDIVALANPLRSLEGDAASVRDALDAIDGPIVLVGHSYGGMVITQAASRHASVSGLVYVGAFAPDTGESAFGLSTMFPGSTLGDALTAHPLTGGGNDLSIRQDRFHAQFAADVPVERAALMAVAQRPVTDVALSTALTTDAPAWKEIPSWFVFGESDRNIPVALSRFMAERAGSMATREIDGGSHAIAVSRPEAIAATILDAVQAATLDAAGV